MQTNSHTAIQMSGKLLLMMPQDMEQHVEQVMQQMPAWLISLAHANAVLCPVTVILICNTHNNGSLGHIQIRLEINAICSMTISQFGDYKVKLKSKKE